MRISAASVPLLVASLGTMLPGITGQMNSTSTGEMGNDVSVTFDEGGNELNYYPPLVHHKFGCVDEGKWKGSCDVELTDPPTGQRYKILAKADWSTQCDPLKQEQQIGSLEYVEGEGWANITSREIVVNWTNPKTPAWTCPPEERSPSGCGDFRTDTRSLSCSETQSLFDCKRPNNADNRVMRIGEMPALDMPQRHACVQHPIFYDNINDSGTRTIPPALGRHRERWAKWGEYDFLPTQRWMHNAEHGGAIFLYHPCLDEESKCALRRLIEKWQDRIGVVQWEGDSEIDKFLESAKDTEDRFRFILTPFKNLWTPISVILWGNIYSSKCFNEAELDEFIASNYRRAYEDWPPNGAYNYLWTDIKEKAASCPALPPASPSTIVNALRASYGAPSGDASDAVKNLTAQVEMLQQEVADLKEAATNQDTRSSSACNMNMSPVGFIATLIIAAFSMIAMAT
uniref:Uncharacterized protein n=1 Tax=Pseudictyota dubia TaxID=2749911 RepID=A0A7R9Z8D2_9STRA|mmetsp:Transcript_30302/g.56221  ORF Transcript_30302/g.56221 Transcript_30302/m.56221 type:complete len:457 (+) Transcript_30302:135-1505(+)